MDGSSFSNSDRCCNTNNYDGEYQYVKYDVREEIIELVHNSAQFLQLWISLTIFHKSEH